MECYLVLMSYLTHLSSGNMSCYNSYTNRWNLDKFLLKRKKTMKEEKAGEVQVQIQFYYYFCFTSFKLVHGY